MHKELEEAVCGKRAVSLAAFEQGLGYLLSSKAVERSWVATVNGNPFAVAEEAARGEWCYTVSLRPTRPCNVAAL